VTDPIYVYEPGNGWVVQSHCAIVQMACGTTVRLELRAPKPGERYMARYKESYDQEDGFNRFVTRAKTSYFIDRLTRDNFGINDHSYVYVTLVKV
jgi:hypothetical protein